MSDTAEVRVRAETPMLGLHYGQETTVTRSPLVEAAIADGRFTVVNDDGEEERLRGAVLDGVLEAAGLPTGGSLAERQARLDAHRAGTDTTPVEVPVEVPAGAPRKADAAPRRAAREG